MKQIFTILFLISIRIVLTASVFAQAPEKMSYQAVVRNSSDAMVTSTQVGMQISILQGSATGIVVYIETQAPTTNANGLVSIEIGAGTLVSGDFAAIDWVNGPYFIKTETDPAGGTNYTITGISQLLSVPFALHSKSAETVTGSITEIDPAFTGSEAANITAADITNLSNLSGTNTGDQDINGIASNTQAIQDTAAQIRADIPDVSGFLTSETDPSVPSGTQIGEMQYWNGSKWVTIPVGSEGMILSFSNGEPVWITLVGASMLGTTDVYNSITGKVWMDRNLGASQVATYRHDSYAFGDLYQWGRATDGHEKRNSSITSTLSSIDNPKHGVFITIANTPYDWRNPQNDNLWWGVNGTNNPCPGGYRLPTGVEWDAERLSWSTDGSAGAFDSSLKLPNAGARSSSDGSTYNVNSAGHYWSSTINGTESLFLWTNISSLMLNGKRADGFAVRCIKD